MNCEAVKKLFRWQTTQTLKGSLENIDAHWADIKDLRALLKATSKGEDVTVKKYQQLDT